METPSWLGESAPAHDHTFGRGFIANLIAARFRASPRA
jgi:hypothetical protein